MTRQTKISPALVPFPVYDNITQAIAAMTRSIAEAASKMHNIVVFPEACLTGLELSWDPATDLPRGLSLDSPELQPIRDSARGNRIHVAFGWIERDGDRLYDSALLIDDEGRDALHYRRVSSGWLGRKPIRRSIAQAKLSPLLTRCSARRRFCSAAICSLRM